MGTGMDKATAFLMKNELDGLHDQIRQWKVKYDTLKASREKLVDNLDRAIQAIEILAPKPFIGLIKLPKNKNRVYCHSGAKQVLAEAEKI